jgi:hypothetical protein
LRKFLVQLSKSTEETRAASVSGCGSRTVQGTETAFGIDPGAALDVWGTVQNGAALGADQMRETGTFPAFIGFEAIVSHQTSVQWPASIGAYFER